MSESSASIARAGRGTRRRPPFVFGALRTPYEKRHREAPERDELALITRRDAMKLSDFSFLTDMGRPAIHRHASASFKAGQLLGAILLG